MTRKRYIPYKNEVFEIFIYTIEKIRTGEWDQEKIVGIAKYFLKNKKDYDPPQDLEIKLEKIIKYISRRIFEYPRLVSGNRKTKKGHKKIESYDYAYKHYIFVILLNFRHHLKSGWFDLRRYCGTVEKNILTAGHVDYKAVGITEESLDRIIRAYEKRIFEYPNKRKI
jgi:hypothetical protein